MKAYITLILMLVLGVLLNYLPHLSYGYPLHVDEWTHFTYAQHLSDNSPLYLGGESNSLEHGFHILLAVLKSVGMPYLIQFQFLASLFTILISLAIFIMVRKYFNEKVALFSVLFFIFIRSSTQFLGSMFLVPLSIGLLFIPIGLFLVNTNLLFLIVSSMLIIHPPSGIALLFLIFSYLIFNFKWRIIFNVVLGVILSLPIFFGRLIETGLSNLQFRESIIPVIFIPRSLGLFIIALIVIGFYLLINQRKYFFVIYSFILLGLITLYYRLNFNILIFYERNIMYLFEIFSIPFALSLYYFTKNKMNVILFLVLLILLIPIKVESTKEVYHIVNETEFNEFISYRDVKGDRAVIDPWKAIAFTPLTKKEVYSRIPPGPNQLYLDRNKEIFDFFNNSCKNETFLRENSIDIVVGC